MTHNNRHRHAFKDILLFLSFVSVQLAGERLDTHSDFTVPIKTHSITLLSLLLLLGFRKKHSAIYNMWKHLEHCHGYQAFPISFQ